MAASVISDSTSGNRSPTTSELATFKMVANPKFVDLNKPRPSRFGSSARPPFVSGFSRKPLSVVSERSAEDDEDVGPGDSASNVGGSHDDDHEPELLFADHSHDHDHDRDHDHGTEKPEPTLIERPVLFATPSAPPKPPSEIFKRPLYKTNVSSAEENANEEVLAEKQSLLQDILEFNGRGFLSSKGYSMSDTLEEIQFEVDRLQQAEQIKSTVEMMKTGLRMGSRGFEAINKKLFKIDVLNGWSNEVVKDVRERKYDGVFARIYKKHWRKGASSPEMELLFLIIGSLVAHVAGRWIGGNINSAAKTSSNDPEPEPSDTNTPAETPKKPVSVPRVAGMPPRAMKAPSVILGPSVGSTPPSEPITPATPAGPSPAQIAAAKEIEAELERKRKELRDMEQAMQMRQSQFQTMQRQIQAQMEQMQQMGRMLAAERASIAAAKTATPAPAPAPAPATRVIPMSKPVVKVSKHDDIDEPSSSSDEDSEGDDRKSKTDDEEDEDSDSVSSESRKIPIRTGRNTQVSFAGSKSKTRSKSAAKKADVLVL